MLNTLLRYFSFIVVLFIFSGCAHKINNQGFVFAISEEELSDSLQDSFPIKEDFIFGNLSIDTPTITMKKDSNKVNIAIDLNLKTLFTPSQKGSFTIVGLPTFNEQERSIYLKDVEITSLSFARMKMSKASTKSFLQALNPMVNQLFEKFPIYTIPNDSFHRNRVKDILVEEGQLMVTYGF